MQFRDILKVNLEKAIDDFIDKGLTEVEILGEKPSVNCGEEPPQTAQKE
jgi:hypothetical protein